MKKKQLKRWLLAIVIFSLLVNTANITRIFYPVKYMNHIKKYAAEYAVDPYLIMSIIKSESNFKPDAVSHKQASGLMQIIKPTAQWIADRLNLTDFEYEQITDPALNIKMGCYYMSYLLNLYDGNEKNALAAYNAGEGNVSRWLADDAYSKDGVTLLQIPYPETRQYITKVMNNQKIYRLLYKIRPAVSVNANPEKTEF